MTISHVSITDPNIHEPKGVSTAVVNAVYVANGAGSGSWVVQEPKGIAAAPSNTVYVSDGAGSGSWQALTKAVRVRGSVDQSLVAATLTILDFDTAEFNTGGYTVANTGRITIPTTGLYAVTAGVTVEATAAALTSGSLFITRNTAIITGSSFDQTLAATATTLLNCSTILELTAGDIVDCRLIASGAASTPIVRNVPTFVGLNATQVNHLAIQRLS